MQNFIPENQHLTKRPDIPTPPKAGNSFERQDLPPTLQWLEKPETKFFEKFDQANNLMDLQDLLKKKGKILKRVKKKNYHKDRIHLKGFRKTIRAQVFETKNLKLQSIFSPSGLAYNCFSYFHFSLV